MKTRLAIGVLLTAGVLAGGTLWRVSEARPTQTEGAAPLAWTAEIGAGTSPSVDRLVSPQVETSGAIAFAEEGTLNAASRQDAEMGVENTNGEQPPESTAPSEMSPPQPPAATGPQPQPVARPQNQPAPLPSRGVIHGQADYTVTVPGQEQRPTTQAEFWIDLESGDARLNEKEAGGNNEVTRVRRGVNQTVLFPQDKRARTEVAPDEQAPYLNAIRDGVLSYRTALDQGAFVILGEEAVNGQPSLRVRPQGPGPDLADIFLSRDYGLPVKEVTYRPNQTGGREEVQTRVSTYRGVEIVARAQLATDLFSPAIPSDWEYVTSRSLDLASAGAFRHFDLYWLGTEYSGMSLARMFHDEVVQSSGRVNVVIVDYAQPATDPQSPAAANQMRVVLGQPLSSEELAARSRGPLPPGAEQVTINGRRAVVFPPQASQGSSGPSDVNAAQTAPTILELPMERGLVVLYGKDRAQVTQAGRDLQKIN